MHDNQDVTATELPQDTECKHWNGRIVSYNPWIEVCNNCGTTFVGDPHSMEPRVKVPND